MMFPLKKDQVSGWGLEPILRNHGDNLNGCELGVCRGHNLVYLLDRVPNISHVYAIDPYSPYIDLPWGLISQEEINQWKTTAQSILQPYSNKITWMELTSHEASLQIPNNILDYIFIDGDHSYEAVYRDTHDYWSKVKVGGIFAGHDWNLKGVSDAVNKFREDLGITNTIQFTQSNVWYWFKE